MTNSICIFALFLIINSLLMFKIVYAQFGAAQDSSFDSLVASQCRARCIGLYPWRLTSPQPVPSALRYFQKRNSASISDVKISSRNLRARSNGKHNRNQRGHFKWNKIMQLCSKNENCLQCTLPCDIPTNLLSNCKYLCKDGNQLCQDSCDLLSKLSQEKYGNCPSFSNEATNTIQLLISAKGQLSESNTVLNQCSSESKSKAIEALIRNNGEYSSQEVNQCGQDSDCGGINKCCPLHTACPQYGNVCAKPVIENKDISTAPFNLSITERKKGKTIILRWDCVYNKNKPTIFVVEGRWSLKSPQSTGIDNQDSHMTKWGYLAQTINNNWIILRNINRGRWYTFRVSAITKSGTLGYSKPTPMFILSSKPKPASQPQNLSIVNIYDQSGTDKINADITWLPSRRSDLPIIHYKLSWRQENSNNPHYGYDLIQDGINKYTITGLLKNTVYSVELIAVSIYDRDELKSKPKRASLNTANILSSHSSYLISDPDSDYDEEDEDIEIYQPRNLHNNIQLENRILNLTIKEAYFRNGLVKAKLSWLLSESNRRDNLGSASIKSIVIEQPMFTITWFPIKCITENGESLGSLPTPITASTINTNLEIYELKYNCDYVVNVRLENNKIDSSISSSINPTPPQVASTKFRVPECNSVRIIGNIKPRCYRQSILKYNQIPAKTALNNIIPEIQYTTTKTTQTTTEEIELLPRVYNIRHVIVGHRSNFYSVKFTWSLPEYFREKNLFSGYQISVVPKAIPGFGNSQSGVSSVGAIVEKDQNSFVVKQLRASIKYIFQIQLIALDNQSYGPASNVEFKIKPIEFKHRGTTLPNRYYSIKERHMLNADQAYTGELYLHTTTERAIIGSTASSIKFSNYVCILTVLVFQFFYKSV